LRLWADIRLQIPFVSDKLIFKDNFRDGASRQLYFRNDGDLRHVTHICFFIQASYMRVTLAVFWFQTNISCCHGNGVGQAPSRGAP